MTQGITEHMGSVLPQNSHSEQKPCGDLRPHLSGYEPKQLAENQDHRHFTEDKQFIEHKGFMCQTPRLQEELVMKEKVLRDTRISGTRKMEELKRAQELRVDDFSVQKIERRS